MALHIITTPTLTTIMEMFMELDMAMATTIHGEMTTTITTTLTMGTMDQ
jgi:hypothetical protein